MIPAPIRLTPADAERYARLRLRMLHDAPWAFEASPDDDVALDLAFLAERLAEEVNAVLAIEAPHPSPSGPSTLAGAPAPPELVAAAGVRRAKLRKFAHRATIWGVYVEPGYRGQGYGRAVVAASVELARTWQGVDFVDLGVSENSPAARALYESLGFQAWGREPETTEYAGRRYDEIYMCLRLG